MWIRPKLKPAGLTQYPEQNLIVITATQNPNQDLIQKNAALLHSLGIPFYVASSNKLLLKNKKINFLFLPELDQPGNKKQLLLALWNSSKAPYFLQIDDDVVLQSNTIPELWRFRWTDLNILPIYTQNTAWWGFFDFLEHLSLVLVGLGYNASQLLTSCSGAYLLYSKALTDEVIQEKDWFLAHHSGDDMDLLHLAKKKGRTIQSIPSPHLWLSTSGKKSIREFLLQRLRWINKPRARQFTGAWVYGTYTILWYWVFLGFAFALSPLLGTSFFLLKTGLDYFLFSRNGPPQQKIKASTILLFELCYPVYLASLLISRIATKNRKW